ncbi:MAG: hemerythrin domain-containing protein [Planctomycetes bacterium]|nr:hemerythrin domain-containing protein [Planctomycetota bacterium]
MTTKKSSSTDFDQIQEEHRSLLQAVDRLGGLLQQPTPRPAAAAAMLAELKDHLDVHFAHEEFGGYFSEVREVAPRFAQQIEVLKLQHVEFLETIDAIGRRLDRPAASTTWWTAIAADFDLFFDEFQRHEAEENELLQEALLRDVGTGD